MIHRRTMIVTLLLCQVGVAGAQPLALKGLTTPVAAGRLGGITAIVRYAIARPDRRETGYTFVTGDPAGAEPPEEVQVRAADGSVTHLTAQEGADCTLAAVSVIAPPKGRGMVVQAVRGFSPVLKDNDYSAPAAMEVQVYRPVEGGDPGESSILLRAVGAPVTTARLCDAADVQRAMLAAARMVR